MNTLNNIFEVIFDEKDNFSTQNQYIYLSNLIKDLVENQTYYKELEIEKNNNIFLRNSRHQLIKENSLLKKILKDHNIFIKL